MAGRRAAPAAGPAVILVGPQLGENVGTAARAMLNFGLTELRLVRPACGWPNVKALNAASGATEVLNRVRLFERVEDAAPTCTASTPPPRGRAIWPSPWSARRRPRARRARRSQRGERVGILFGPERTGLANDELVLADAVLRVPVNPGVLLAQPRPGGAAGRLRVVPVGGAACRSAGTVAPAGRPGDQGRARPAARASGRRARRGRLLPHRRPAPEHGARAPADLRPRRAARARRPPAARRDQAARPRGAAGPARRAVRPGLDPLEHAWGHMALEEPGNG